MHVYRDNNFYDVHVVCDRLKDAVRETVREIRTESKTRLKQFIRNKEVCMDCCCL